MKTAEQRFRKAFKKQALKRFGRTAGRQFLNGNQFIYELDSIDDPEYARGWTATKLMNRLTHFMSLNGKMKVTCRLSILYRRIVGYQLGFKKWWP